MSELRPVPELLIGLKARHDEAIDFMNAVDCFDGRVGVEIQPSSLLAHGDAIIGAAREHGFYTIANTNFSNEPSLQADAISEYVMGSSRYSRHARNLPDAITVEPQPGTRSDSGTQRLMQAVTDAEAHGVRIIGTPNSYALPIEHVDSFVQRAALAYQYLTNIGICTAEFIFPTLEHLQVQEGIAPGDFRHSVVSKSTVRMSKPSYSPKPQPKSELKLLEEGVRASIAKGAGSILVGRSVMREPTNELRQARMEFILSLISDERAKQKPLV